VDGVPNDLIAGSGTKLAIKPLDAPYSALPSLGGSYRSLTQHPGVFMTSDELKDIGVAHQSTWKLFDAALRPARKANRKGY
jgi:hypothetical protein